MFRGSIPALVTPFRDGDVDEEALVGLVEWHVAEGSHGIVAVGTTGETPTLSHDEHERCVEVVVKTAAGRIPVIAGAGSNNTEESVRLMRLAARVGADAALVVMPYYNKPSQRGLYHHFRALHDAVHLPIIIYNIPGRSVVDIAGDDGRAREAAAHRRRQGRHRRRRPRLGPAHRLRQGLPAALRRRRQRPRLQRRRRPGRISVVANVAPRLSASSRRRCSPATTPARSTSDRLMPLHRADFAEPNPAPTKFALSRSANAPRPSLADGPDRGAGAGKGPRRHAPREAAQLAASGLGPAGELRAYRPVVLLAPGGIVGLDPARDKEYGIKREQEAEDQHTQDGAPAPTQPRLMTRMRRLPTRTAVGHQRDDFLRRNMADSTVCLPGKRPTAGSVPRGFPRGRLAGQNRAAPIEQRDHSHF